MQNIPGFGGLKVSLLQVFKDLKDMNEQNIELMNTNFALIIFMGVMWSQQFLS